MKCLVVHTTAHQNTVHEKERKKERKKRHVKMIPSAIIMYAVMDGLGDGKLTRERGNGHLDNGQASNMGNIDH